MYCGATSEKRTTITVKMEKQKCIFLKISIRIEDWILGMNQLNVFGLKYFWKMLNFFLPVAFTDSLIVFATATCLNCFTNT